MKCADTVCTILKSFIKFTHAGICLFVIGDFYAYSMTPCSQRASQIENGKPMILTANLSPHSIAGTGDVNLQRLYSRPAAPHPVGITGADRSKVRRRMKGSMICRGSGRGDDPSSCHPL
ncbi:MAG: hypothetical protein ACYCWE_02940 [Eubacteriales bacterium]